MTTRRAIVGSVLTLFMLATMLVAPTPAAAAPPSNGSLTTAIVQTIPGVGTFVGTLTTNSFTFANGVLSAVGTITGTLTSPTGQILNTVTSAPITVPLTGLTGTCTILTLHTGAISLSVLGLNVSLAPIDLVITATAGPGNLLGNLLCAVAHLLDSGGPLASLGTALSNLLTQILGAIRV